MKKFLCMSLAACAFAYTASATEQSIQTGDWETVDIPMGDYVTDNRYDIRSAFAVYGCTADGEVELQIPARNLTPDDSSSITTMKVGDVMWFRETFQRDLTGFVIKIDEVSITEGDCVATMSYRHQNAVSRQGKYVLIPVPVYAR